MQSKINELYEKLISEYELLEKILKIEEEKNGYLVQGKLKDFTEMNENLEKLVNNSSKMELERIKLTEEIMTTNKLNKDSNLGELIPLIPQPLREKFEKLYDDFKNILMAIKLYSNTNSEMLRNTLDILDITLSHLTEDHEIEYGDYENNVKPLSKSVLLNKLA